MLGGEKSTGGSFSVDSTEVTMRQARERAERMHEWRTEMSRLSDKLAQAAGVAKRQTEKIEARADAMIAREASIEARTDKAFSPHEMVLDSHEKELDKVEDALRQLSNM